MDTLIADVAKKAGVFIHKVNAAFDLITNRPTISVAPVTEITEFSVGPGKDFETLAKAFIWLQEVSFGVGGRVIFNLSDGIHLIEEIPGTTGYWTSYPIYNGHITFAGNWADRTAVTIALDPSVPDAELFMAFSVLNVDALLFNYITFDPGAAGHTTANEKMRWATVTRNAYVHFFDCIMDGGQRGIEMYLDSHLIIEKCEIKNFVQTAIYVEHNSTAYIWNVSTITGNGLGISCGAASRVIFNTDSSASGNTVDYSIPVNEIQYSGAYISTALAALSFKA